MKSISRVLKEVEAGRMLTIHPPSFSSKVFQLNKQKHSQIFFLVCFKLIFQKLQFRLEAFCSDLFILPYLDSESMFY